MPKFESTLTNRAIATPPGQQPMRNFDVPDASGYQPPSDQAPGGHSSPTYPQGQPSQKFSPSITRRMGPAMSDAEMQEFQARLAATQDPDLSLSDAERDMRRLRQEKIQGQQMLNDGAKRRIEMLIGMTRHVREADIDGNVYILQTLKAKEMREAISAASEYDGSVQSPFEIRKQLLARSIVQIAGVPFGQFVGSDTLEAKFAMIDELDDILLNRIMAEYSLMVNEAKDKFAIKTQEEVKEVAEDLKK